MRIANLFYVYVFFALAACATVKYVDVSDVIKNPDSFDGKDVELRGYIVADAINIPHLFASKQDAVKIGNEDYGLDLLPATKEVDIASRIQSVSCVIAVGVFHAPTQPNLGMGTLTSKVGSLNLQTIEPCK